jgi:hypothetical protein
MALMKKDEKKKEVKKEEVRVKKVGDGLKVEVDSPDVEIKKK